MPLATIETKVTGVPELKNLVALVSEHKDELPQELVEQLQEWPEICDVVQELKQECEIAHNRNHFLENEADKWHRVALRKDKENKRLKSDIYHLQKIKRRLFKKLGLSRKGKEL